MTYKIIYSPESLDDLRAIYYYLVDNNGGKVSIVRIFYSGRDVEHIIQTGIE